MKDKNLFMFKKNIVYISFIAIFLCLQSVTCLKATESFNAVAEKDNKSKIGVIWENTSFSEALLSLKSKKNMGKLLFVDCYTQWCGPCKHMSNNVLSSKKAGDFFNSRYVSIKIDMEKGDGIQLVEKFKITAYPTFIVFDSNKIEIGRVIGSAEIDDFIEKVEYASDIKNSPNSLLNNFINTKTINDAYNYLSRLKYYGNNKDISSFIKKYYNDFDVRDKYSIKMWPYIVSSMSLEDNYMVDIVLNDKILFDENIGKANVDLKLLDVFINGLKSYLSGNLDMSNESLKKYIALTKLLNNGNIVNSIVIRSAEAQFYNLSNTIPKIFDIRFTRTKCGEHELLALVSLFLNIKSVSDLDKAEFVKQVKGGCDALSAEVSRYAGLK